jgi:3-oxoacyl-[acyl-carrier protein] reductase
MNDLKDKKVFITGGSRGIGLDIMKKFYDFNSKICIIGSNLENLEKVKKEFSKIEIAQLDLSDTEKLTEKFSELIKTFGGIDVLVNNAGATKDNLAMRMSKEEWSSVLNLNLSSPFLLCQESIKAMLKNKAGSIINISSVVGHTGNAGQSNYAASKAGLVALTKSLAKEYAKKNIRCNCISPGFIQTDMTAKLKDEYKLKLMESIPSGRLGTGQDIANAVIFLASDMSSYITGETIHVNGGMYMA